MSEQNPTVEDSVEYRRLKRENMDLLEALATPVEDSEEYMKLLDELQEEQLRNMDNVIVVIKLNKLLDRANELIKTFHYGPVDEDYKRRVKEYIEENTL